MGLSSKCHRVVIGIVEYVITADFVNSCGQSNCENTVNQQLIWPSPGCWGLGYTPGKNLPDTIIAVAPGLDPLL